ncbi:MAG: ATP synthase F0 subunit B [Bdellovibrionota bacterium]|nr:ATP synthase F0 subunit B [Bdellovibrionota bacterium]
MDLVLNILKQLGADNSFVYQLAVIVVVFIIAKFLFLDHLQAVIERREAKTVKLEGDAEKQFDEINKIQDEYKQKIQTASKEVREKLTAHKSEIIKKEEARYRSNEAEINTYIEKTRSEVEAEINEKKEEVLKEADKLATNLVKKLSKEI